MSRWGRALGPLGGWGLEGARSLELPLALRAPASVCRAKWGGV